MNSLRFRMYLYPALFLVALAFSLQLGAQETNLVKDVMAHKGQIDWKSAPAGAIPESVCDLLNACGKAKVASLKPAMESGETVKRGMFLMETGNPKQPDAVVLVHYAGANEVYYFLLGPDGSVQKTVYGEYNHPYQIIANMLGQPTFNKDKKAWQDWLDKLLAGEKKS